MSKILIIMRHAKPETAAGVEDFDIPLSKAGALAQKRLCAQLQNEGFCPKKVLASPFRRAEETAQVVADHFKLECVTETALGEPFDGAKILQLVQDSPAEEIALVGHGPSLTDMANQLLGRREFKDILPKSSALILEFQGEVKKGSGTLLKYLPGA
jgi:phosphohistidine phosphatase